MSPRGRRASLPPVGQQPRSRANGSGLVVRLNLEDHRARVVDLTELPGPKRMREELATALSVRTNTSDGARRNKTVDAACYGIRVLMQWVEAVNQDRSETDKFESFTDWRRWDLLDFRGQLYRVYAETTAFGIYSTVRTLLREIPGLNGELFTLTSARTGQPPRSKTNAYENYTRSEIRSLRAAAKRVIKRAHARISANYELALRHPLPHGDVNAERAAALNQILTLGEPSTLDGYRALGAYREYYATAPNGRRYVAARRGLKEEANASLFPTKDEAIAMVVWLVVLGDYNLSVVTSMRLPSSPGAGHYQLDLDKPRRGSRSRFWSDVYDGKKAATIATIVETTNPLRRRMKLTGNPTDLLVGWATKTGQMLAGNPMGHQERRQPKWFPKGEDGKTKPLKFRQLRRSGSSVPKEPTHHDSDMHLKYLRDDPSAVQAQQVKATDAIGVARRNAALLLKAIVVGLDTEAPGPAADAVVTACLDVLHNPATGTECREGFFGFLLCLACPNAVSAPRHLPIQIATLNVLDELRSSLSEDEWASRFEGAWHQLTVLVGQYRSPTEIEQARKKITEADYRLITAALQGRSKP